MSPPRLAAALAAALVLAVTNARAEETFSLQDRSISPSKQFVVYAKDPAVRSAISRQAEDYKAEFLNLLGIDDEFKFTIIVNLTAPPPKQRNPPKTSLRLYELDQGELKIQLDVFDRAAISEPEFDRDLMGTVLLEYAYRNNPTSAGRSFESPPAWVIAGLLEKINVRVNGPEAAAYATLLAAGQTPSIDDFFRTRAERLDPTSRIIFAAQSLAMLDTLRALPEGRPGLHYYLAVPRRSPPSTNDIIELFPALDGNREALSRKWILAIAAASATDRIDLLGVRESSKTLDGILDVQALPDPKNPEVAAMSGPLALGAIARSESGSFILSQMRNDLLRLSLKAHPLYKGLTDEYLQIITELLSKPKRRLEKRIAAAEEVRAGLSRKTTEIDSYLDYVEATKVQADSDTFTDIVEDTEASSEAPPRPDAISQFLDAYEAGTR